MALQPQTVSQPHQPEQPPTEYETQQEQLAAIVAPLIAAAVARIDVNNLGQSLQQFTVTVGALVNRYGHMASTLALRWYQRDRAAHGAPGRVSVPLPKPPTVAQTAAILDIEELLEAPQVTPEVVQSVAESVTATVEQAILTQGDETVKDAVSKDKAAKGWARGLEPGFCSFCAMLATRGAVYKSKSAAQVKVHTHCHCYPIAVFDGYIPGPRERHAMDVWKSAVTDKHLTGAEAQKAYRAALEGREYIPGKGASKPHDGTNDAQLQRDIALGAERRAELVAKLRKSEAACKKSGMVSTLRKVRERISQLEAANIADRKTA